MKAKVTIVIEIDTTEYLAVESTEQGIRDLVDEMLNAQADLPAYTIDIKME